MMTRALDSTDRHRIARIVSGDMIVIQCPAAAGQTESTMGKLRAEAIERERITGTSATTWRVPPMVLEKEPWRRGRPLR
jgi:hypothetical protein